jgi:hypothetical protein
MPARVQNSALRPNSPQASPSPAKQKALGFIWSYSSESELFNGLRRIQIKNLFSLTLAVSPPLEAGIPFRRPGEDTTACDFPKGIVRKIVASSNRLLSLTPVRTRLVARPDWRWSSRERASARATHGPAPTDEFRQQWRIHHSFLSEIGLINSKEGQSGYGP